MISGRALISTLAPLSFLIIAGCAAPPPHRYFQATANQIGPEPNSYGEAVVPSCGLVAVQGDDFAYGRAPGRSRRTINGATQGQAAITISQALRKAVDGVRVENRGFPGDTVEASTTRWSSHPPGNLLILALGYGDAEAQTPIGHFAEGFDALVRGAQAKGAAVFVIVPPPISDPLKNTTIEAYRNQMRGIAQADGAEMFEAFTAETRIKAKPSRTLAQSSAVYQAVAADMAPYIKAAAASNSGARPLPHHC